MRGVVWPLVAGVLLVSPGIEARGHRGRVIDIDGPRLHLSDLLGPVARDVDLGPAPRPGSVRDVPRGRLRGEVVPSQGRRLPRFFRVRTRSQVLTCAAFHRRLAAALRETLPAGIVVRKVDCRGPLVLPRGPLDLRARIEGRRRAGRLYVNVRLRAGRWPWRRLVVPMVADGLVDVVVVGRNVASRRALVRDDLRVEKRQASSLREDVISSLVEALRWESRTPLRAGTILRKSLLQPIPVVRKGAQVTVLVQLPGLRVASSGRVRQNGGRGDTVWVLCQKTRKLLRARVVGPTRVVVDL